LPLFDEDNIVEITQFKRHAIEDIANTVTVKYWDGETGEDGSITRSDIALVARTGRSSVTTIDYPGITSTALADYVVNRDLHALSMPLANAIIVTTTEGLQLSPGSPFLFSWELYGITQMVMRVTSVKYGEFGDSRITIECTEDVFGISDSIYTAPPPTGWEPIGTDPEVSPMMIAWEIPYRLLQQSLSQAEIESMINSDLTYVGIIGVKPTQDTFAANTAYQLNSSDEDRDTSIHEYFDQILPYRAQSTSAITRLQTVIPMELDYGEWEDIEIGMWATFAYDGAVASEIAYVSDINSAEHEVTLLRGCCDTVPVAYTVAGVNIVFFHEFPYNSSLPVHDGDHVFCWWRAVTTRGYDDSDYDQPDLTGSRTVTCDKRLNRPLLPGRIRINSSVDPALITDGADIVITWKTRGRAEPYGYIIHHDTDLDITPDATEYHVELYDNSDPLDWYGVDTHICSKYASPATGSITFTAEEIVLDEAPFSGPIKAYIYSRNSDGDISTSRYYANFTYEQAEE